MQGLLSDACDGAEFEPQAHRPKGRRWTRGRGEGLPGETQGGRGTRVVDLLDAIQDVSTWNASAFAKCAWDQDLGLVGLCRIKTGCVGSV
jgi:hypothetical protein